ncbi:transmembrane protein, putative [Medicago truncatula]|uniref:Transmembrane protein, putative n=1 Tax=Medicago truncatula TaxID=3880 RepID=A0A072TK30_MEDTR|nr:transmembrane protein, putative [Medicago truncatula]
MNGRGTRGIACRRVNGHCFCFGGFVCVFAYLCRGFSVLWYRFLWPISVLSWVRAEFIATESVAEFSG